MNVDSKRGIEIHLILCYRIRAQSFFFFFFFETHFILEYKPMAKPSRNYELLHLRNTWYTRLPHISPSPHQ
jgi:hypothetical protein